MPIIVKRQTKWLRAFAPIALKINKKTRALLWNKEEIELPLNDRENILKIRGSRGSQIKVTDGDTILITDNPVNALCFWGSVAIMILGQFIFLPGSWTMAIITWIGILGICLSLLLKRFIITKM